MVIVMQSVLLACIDDREGLRMAMVALFHFFLALVKLVMMQDDGCCCSNDDVDERLI